jgi:hypothetical protein
MKFKFKQLNPEVNRYSFNGFRYSGYSLNFSKKGFKTVYNYNYAFVEADTIDKAFRLTFLTDEEKGAFMIRFPGAGPIISCKIPDMPKGRYLQSAEDPSIFILSK